MNWAATSWLSYCSYVQIFHWNVPEIMACDRFRCNTAVSKLMPYGKRACENARAVVSFDFWTNPEMRNAIFLKNNWYPNFFRSIMLKWCYSMDFSLRDINIAINMYNPDTDVRNPIRVACFSQQWCICWSYSGTLWSSDKWEQLVGNFPSEILVP